MCHNMIQVSCRWFYNCNNIGHFHPNILDCAEKKLCYRFLLPNRSILFVQTGVLVRSWLFRLQNFPCLRKVLDACLGWLWRLQQRTSYVGSLGVELVVQPFTMQNWVWPTWTNMECSVFKPPHQNKSCPKSSRKHDKIRIHTTQHTTKVAIESKDNSNDEFKGKKNWEMILHALRAKPS